MEKEKQVIEIHKQLGAVGYILNGWSLATKGTKYAKFGVKHKSNMLIKEFEKIEKSLTEYDKNNPVYAQVMQQMHNVTLVYNAVIDATYSLSNDQIKELDQCIKDKLLQFENE